MKAGWFLLLSWGCGPQGSEPRGRPDGPPGPRDTGDEPDDGLVVGELGPSPWADDPPKMAEPVPGRPWQGEMDAKEADGVILQGGGRGEGTSSLGKYIGVLPDVTGDDVPELAFHHTVPDGTRRNYIHLYSGVTDSTTLRAPPAAAIRNQGWRDIFLPTLYGNVGDVDGDGFDDLLIGTTSTGWHGYLDLPQSGSAYIVPGPVTGKASLRDIQTGFLFLSLIHI